MGKKLKFLLVLMFMSSVTVYAVEDQNTGKILQVGKINGAMCTVKVEGAVFPNTCATATYQQAYFTCSNTEGDQYLSIALAAYMAGKSVRIVTDSCSQYGASVANLVGIHLE